MKRTISLLIALSLLLTGLVGCSSAGDGGESAQTSSVGAEGQTGEDADGTYAIIGRSTGNPYVEKELEGYKIAVEELGGTAILKLPEAPTVEAQLGMIQEVIAQRVDCIAVASNDYDALQPTLTQAMEEGIKVLSLDSAVNPVYASTQQGKQDLAKARIKRLRYSEEKSVSDNEGDPMDKSIGACGVDCGGCPEHGKACGGCHAIEGRVFWAPDIG